MKIIKDKIKVIPPSYIQLSKGFFNDPGKWIQRAENQGRIMLGGDYDVLKTQVKNQEKWHLLISDSSANWISDDFVVNSNDVKICRFKIGDKVLYKPQCEQSDKEFIINFLNKYYDFLDPKKTYTVKYVLNDYYIFVDFDRDDVRSFPFRWLDFELV